MRLLKILMVIVVVLVVVDLAFNNGELLHSLSLSARRAALEFRWTADRVIDSFFRR
jgi:hypothetical protein